MALVTKNDVTQIFAIQAPAIDLPPTFANYPRGWDTARSNNGKPTIKQFNYIQQRTDQNVLYIHQNGAALPYDATMEYAENAHVVKDGELQKKQGAGWVIPYLGKSNNLSDVPDKATARNNLEVMSATEVNTAISNAIPPTTPIATETIAGKVKINNTLNSTATDAALTAAQGKVLQDNKLETAVAFGVGQTWQNLTGSRALGTTYTNSTNKSIVAYICGYVGAGATQSGTINGNVVQRFSGFSSGLTSTVTLVIPVGGTYSANGAIESWWELR